MRDWAPIMPAGSAREIEVWPLRLAAADDVIASFQAVLAPAEIAQAARFRFAHLQRRFVLSRGVLRMLLAHYLHIPAQAVEFTYSSSGKPHLAAAARIHFNMSHSGDMGLLAFAFDCDLGIDIERIRPLRDISAIANRFFCAEEAADLESLPIEQRERAFFLCWTRKEAYVKAVGTGLAAPLNRFRVSFRPSEPARFIHIDGDASAEEGWTLCDLRVAPEYAAALAYNDSPRRVRMLPLLDPAEIFESKIVKLA